MNFPTSPYSLVVTVCTIVVLALLPGTSAVSQVKKADPLRGQQLAERLCSNCHVVVPGRDVRAIQGASGFKEIANRADQTADHVAGRMIIPHPDMPSIALTNTEIRDIVGYIMSLKTAP